MQNHAEKMGQLGVPFRKSKHDTNHGSAQISAVLGSCTAGGAYVPVPGMPSTVKNGKKLLLFEA